jgi:hypothetical protein
MPWIGGNFKLLFDFRADQAAGPPFSRITADRMMQQLEDVAATMSEGLRADGSVSMASNLNMDGHKIVNAADAATATELATLRQAASNLKYAGTFDQTTLGVNDISATNALAPTPVEAGYEFVAFLASTNSGPMTCALNGSTRRALVSRSGAPFVPGDVRGNQYLRVLFTGTEYRIQDATQSAINGAVLGAADNPNKFLYVSPTGEVDYKSETEVRALLGLQTVAVSGSYNDLLDKPNVLPVVVAPLVGAGTEASPLDLDVELLTGPQLAQIVALMPEATTSQSGVVNPETYRILEGVDRLMRYYGREFLIDPLTLPDGTHGVAYTYTPTTEDGEAPLAWSLAPGSDALPSALTLNASTGAITGTPAAAGVRNITLRLTDSFGFYKDFPSTLTIA